jgi:hypothetical protein
VFHICTSADDIRKRVDFISKAANFGNTLANVVRKPANEVYMSSNHSKRAENLIFWPKTREINEANRATPSP